MKLFVRNKIISWGGASAVLNENKEPAFKVKGKIFSITKKKFIMNLDKERLFTVRNKYWHLLYRSAYIYNANKERIIKIKKNVCYKVESTEDEFRIERDVIGLTLTVFKGDDVFCVIRKNITFIADSFEVEVEKEEDAPLAVAFAIAVDNIGDIK